MQPSQIYGDLDHTLLIRFKKTVFQVCFVLLGIGIPLLMTLVTFTVPSLAQRYTLTHLFWKKIIKSIRFCKITEHNLVQFNTEVYYSFFYYLFQSGYYSDLITVINVGLGGLGEYACVF